MSVGYGKARHLSQIKENIGRPTKEIFAAMGVLILQQMHDMTDEETVSPFPLSSSGITPCGSKRRGKIILHFCMASPERAQQFVISQNRVYDYVYINGGGLV